MKHAGAETLARLEKFLRELRKLPLHESKPGIFYLKRTAFLHFHEDPAGLFADVKVGSTFQRYPVNTLTQRHSVLRIAKDQLNKL